MRKRILTMFGTRPEVIKLAPAWSVRAEKSDNPFGHGDSGMRTAHAIARVLGVERAAVARTR
jgi:UDP-N-acetylglucosamine 2-epimerase